jgi:hypothetical protein
MPWQIVLPWNLDAPMCLSQCSDFGYNAAGLEDGVFCYCGDISHVEAGTSTLVPDDECTIICPGNSSAICGDSNLLSYYTWTGIPLYNWSTPTGPDMGAYEFLIGGVVVPLLVTASVNGKVTFLEKWGTSEAPNSTGAYELDLAEIDNFSAAWRPMHVKTDVFCSASLILPDRVGRQINIAGWSGVSNFGVRLYWPDGSPGVAGTNDWEENSNELQLQAPRWYASAMVMANGSVLVVGGEAENSGPPQPTLEILPKTGGGLVYLDFLQETDPNNLYPFVCAIPSGIFIVYVNNARILDQNTFETITLLPQIPGNVNQPGAGRSYPYEGTGMILPQHYPYTDPVSILICGGSTYDGQCMDNCALTQPEVANATWTIERMPSKRVMTCVAALPDGTFLIANGAQQGIAGFGTSSNPNLGAILYDPSKPVGSRMSIMATTIVARLYHSEATLLQDGRVLISGSDPEDARFPQEYRVEVFMPPYLLNGATPPTLSCTDQDWAYGGTYSCAIFLPTGNTSGAKFSLISAVSSTHGNSMGMRTLFPEFSCSGTTCSITAPPDSTITPPGWFQLFLLDGPTPSYSVWVRIGGDPAEFGNWPNLPDFNVPGMGALGPTY